MLEENFDIVEKLGTHNNFKEQRNTKAYKLLVENKVDTNEYLNIDKENGAGTYPVKEKDTEIQKANEESFLNDLLEFGNTIAQSDVGKSVGSRFQEGWINIADFGTNIFNTFDKLFSLDPQYKRSEIFTNFSNNLEKTRNKLQEKREGLEGTWSDMVGMLFQDAPATVTLYKAFRKAKIKDRYAVPLSFGLGYAMAFDEKDPTFIIPSEWISNVKHLLNVLPDTPEDQLTDDVFELIEGTAMAALIPGLIKSLKFIKKNVPSETATDVGRLLATGTVAAGSVMAANQAKGDEIPAIPEPININEKPVIDVSDPKHMEMGMSSPKLAELAIQGGKRIIAGISRQKKKIPTTIEQQELALPLIKTFDDDVKVLTYKVDDSVGKFADDLERNLDIEALVKNDFDTNKIINTAVQQARKFDQESVFVSEQVLGKTSGSNVAFTVRFSTPKKFGDAIDISKELERITGLQGYTFKTKAVNLGDLPIANPKFTPKKGLYHNALKQNGVTDDLREAAFIGPDGKMISGGQEAGYRVKEHRDVVKLAYESKVFTDIEYGIGRADFSQMFKFMEETGSIRISANGPFVSAQVYQKPTISQLRTLVKKYNETESFERIVIEAVLPKGIGVKTFTRVEPQYVLNIEGKITLSQLEKFLDFQAIRGKRFISIDSMNIPQYSNISNDAFMEKLMKIESNLSNTFGTKDFSKPKLEYYINNVINKEDYAKYK